MNEVLGIPFLVGRRVAFPINPGAFRLFLAMLVFVHHFSSLGLGAYAVYVFFVLSGFWLQRMWTERYRMTRQPYLTYMISRVWRLAPVMILVSIITIMLLLVIGIPAAKVFAANGAHLTFSSIFLLGYSWLPYAPVGSAWSLDVEMQFYIVAPLLALAAVMPKGRWLLLAVAALCSLAFSTLHVVPILPKYIVFFMVGMVAAGSGWRPSAKQATVSAMAVILAVLFVLISPWRGILIGGATPGPLFRYNFNYNIALAFATVPYAIYTTTRKSDATDRMMADLSFILYLSHWAAMQWFFTIHSSFGARLAVAATSFAVVPAVSWLIWRFYDKPINRMRSRWVASRTISHSMAGPLAEPAAP